MEKKCCECKEFKDVNLFHKNKCQKDGFSCKCKECTKLYNKVYRENNLEYFKNYLSNHRLEYERNRLKTDSLFKLAKTVRKRTAKAFKRMSWSKNSSNINLLGASFEEVHSYLEGKFLEGMSWDNHGEWHIDHIIPLASANTEEDIIPLCHYTNLQPLWAKDNLSKGKSCT